MSALRHRYRLVIDGVKHEITTSARDMAAAEIDPTEPNSNVAEQTFRLLHAACIRSEIPGIPSDWESFADLIDDVDDLESEAEIAPVNPTHATG